MTYLVVWSWIVEYGTNCLAVQVKVTCRDCWQSSTSTCQRNLCMQTNCLLMGARILRLISQGPPARAPSMLCTCMQVRMPHNGQPVVLRIGVHTGPLVSGLVGARMPK